MKVLEGKTILVVDDEPGYREVLEDECASYGAKVFTADSGSAAINVLKTQNIDAVITDVRMPNGDGIELLESAKHISGHFAKMPIFVLISGYADITHEDAYNKGADGIFSKPCDLDSLIQSLCRSLKSAEEKWSENAEIQDTPFNIEIKMDLVDSHNSEHPHFALGRGGLYVALNSDQMPQLNAMVKFKIVTSQKALFEGIGTCRWVRGKSARCIHGGIGLEFFSLTKESLQNYIQFVKDRLPIAFIPRGP